VLSDSFAEVLLVERDVLPASPEHRRGTPQARHTHGLLASGREIMESLLPGLSDDLVARGALTGDIAGDCRWFFESACLCRPPSGFTGLLMTRPMLEAVVRARVLARPNVRKRDNAAVSGLAVSRDSNRLEGVTIGVETVRADLVVDATGRGSRAAQWLESMGYQKPSEETVQVALGYTTRFFRRKPGDLGGDVAAIIAPTPTGKRGGVMLAQEHDRWTVTLISHFGNYAPEDLAGFIEFARTLPAPYIHEVIRSAEPLGDAATARFPANLRRRYERLERFPDGFLVIGDAICSFNPIYGQGMSVAALQALELQDTLAAGAGDLARRFFRRAAKVVDTPWSIAVGNDLRMPEAVGQRTPGVKFVNWYMSKLHRAGHADPAVALAFHKVANLVAPPSSILHPRIAARVLWRNLAGTSKGARLEPFAQPEPAAGRRPMPATEPVSQPSRR
jgi:2-polyprenyl-6-methoxyphenol hydroxylase-like FAD-dependent oxidoreductase